VFMVAVCGKRRRHASLQNEAWRQAGTSPSGLVHHQLSEHAT